jgi:hypothetical protein
MTSYCPAIFYCLLFSMNIAAQTNDSAVSTRHASSTANSLFSEDSVLAVTIKGDTRALLNDREGEPKNFSLSLLYKDKDNATTTIPVEIKTRGHFRRMKQNCFYPPLLLQFSGNNKASSLFPSVAKLKLVMPCKGDEFVVREWLAYKIYNLVTPESFKARLVRVTLENDKNGKSTDPFFGIIIEEDNQMAKRNGLVAVNRKLKPQNAAKAEYLKMAVFEYLIGNTDWSVEYLQNIKLIARDSMSVPYTVPYDFDHAGIVSAPYALPAEELQMGSVRERRYRGYCLNDMKEFDPAISEFNRLKNDIYNLYSACTILDARYIKSTLKYLDDFYKTINDPKDLQKQFGYPCDKNGTGNVIIRGLKEN